MQVRATLTRRTRVRKSVPQVAAALLLSGANQIGTSADAGGRNLTSGTVSARDLRLVYHYPFARAHPGGLPPLPINVQTPQGGLRDSLHVTVFSTGQVALVTLYFTSPHAIVLTPGGTQTMIDRGFQAALKQSVRPAFLLARARLRRARLV